MSWDGTMEHFLGRQPVFHSRAWCLGSVKPLWFCDIHAGLALGSKCLFLLGLGLEPTSAQTLNDSSAVARLETGLAEREPLELGRPHSLGHLDWVI